MKIGTVGAGNIGAALGGHFHKVKHTVWIANSRGPETLSEVAKKTGATPVSVSEVAKGMDLLVVTIPVSAVPFRGGLGSTPENNDVHRPDGITVSPARITIVSQPKYGAVC